MVKWSVEKSCHDTAGLRELLSASTARCSFVPARPLNDAGTLHPSIQELKQNRFRSTLMLVMLEYHLIDLKLYILRVSTTDKSLKIALGIAYDCIFSTSKKDSAVLERGGGSGRPWWSGSTSSVYSGRLLTAFQLNRSLTIAKSKLQARRSLIAKKLLGIAGHCWETPKFQWSNIFKLFQTSWQKKTWHVWSFCTKRIPMIYDSLHHF